MGYPTDEQFEEARRDRRPPAVRRQAQEELERMNADIDPVNDLERLLNVIAPLAEFVEKMGPALESSAQLRKVSGVLHQTLYAVNLRKGGQSVTAAILIPDLIALHTLYRQHRPE